MNFNALLWVVIFTTSAIVIWWPVIEKVFK